MDFGTSTKRGWIICNIFSVTLNVLKIEMYFSHFLNPFKIVGIYYIVNCHKSDKDYRVKSMRFYSFFLGSLRGGYDVEMKIGIFAII